MHLKHTQTNHPPHTVELFFILTSMWLGAYYYVFVSALAPPRCPYMVYILSNDRYVYIHKK